MKKYLIPVSIILASLILLAYYLLPPTQQPATPTNKVSAVTETRVSDVNDFYQIEATYPVDPRDTTHAIAQFVDAQVNKKKEEWKIGGDIYNEEQDVAKHFPDRPKMQYQYLISYTSSTSEKFHSVTYEFSTYEFTGGANGNTTITTFTLTDAGLVDIQKVINFAENNNDIALSKVLAKQIIAAGDEYTNQDMVNEGLGIAYLKEDGKTLDKEKCHCDGFFFPSNFMNFALEDNGIRFMFSKYQVAPGAVGTPDYLLTWDVLRPFLTQEFRSQYSIQ